MKAHWCLFSFLCLFLVACQVKPLKRDKPVVAPKSSVQTPTTGGASVPTLGPVDSQAQSQVSGDDPDQDSSEVEPTPIVEEKKVGLILGGGGLRSFAHIGVLQELHRQKIPIHAVAGIEMGSLVASIYAVKGLPFEVEWQMMKLKEKDLINKTILSGKAQAKEVSAMSEFLADFFTNTKVEQFKTSFSCPSLNLDQQRIYLLSKGVTKDLLPYCMGIGPLFQPFQGNTSALMSLPIIAESFRQRGINYIIYVDVLAPPIKIESSEDSELIAWSSAAELGRRKDPAINYVLQVPLKGVDFLDYSKRRENLQKGQKAVQENIKALQRELNL